MDGPHGSMGSIADRAGEESTLMWGAPIVCEVFEIGLAVESVEHEWKAGVERRSARLNLLEV
jgi:hypothetical protein